MTNRNVFFILRVLELRFRLSFMTNLTSETETKSPEWWEPRIAPGRETLGARDQIFSFSESPEPEPWMGPEPRPDTELQREGGRVTLGTGSLLVWRWPGAEGNMCSIIGITVTLAQLFTGEDNLEMLSKMLYWAVNRQFSPCLRSQVRKHQTHGRTVTLNPLLISWHF